MSAGLDPLDRYGARITILEDDPSEGNDIEACRVHAEAIGFVWRAPWYARWWRRRRLDRLMRRHVRAMGEDHRLLTWRQRYGARS